MVTYAWKRISWRAECSQKIRQRVLCRTLNLRAPLEKSDVCGRAVATRPDLPFKGWMTAGWSVQNVAATFDTETMAAE